MSIIRITQEFLDALKEEFSKSEFHQYLTMDTSENFQSSLDLNLDCGLTGRIPKKLENKFNEFKEIIFDLGSELLGDKSFETVNNIFQVDYGFCKGEKFTGDLDCFDTDGKKFSVTHDKNNILLIDFWATWCKFCQKPMQENVDLMKEHPELKEKHNIHIIGISSDEDQKEWINHIKNKEWQNIQHYNKANIHRLLQLRGIPFILIIGKDGIIKYSGHPRKINLKETLLNLAENKDIVNSIYDMDFWDYDSSIMDKTNTRNYQWNFEYDNKKKCQIIYEINQILKKEGLEKVKFTVYSIYELEKNGYWKKLSRFFFDGDLKEFKKI